MCDDCCPYYQTFPAFTFGGVGGDYFVTCPVTSCKWAEYRILSISTGYNSSSRAFISGDSPPTSLIAFPATDSYTDNQVIPAMVFRVSNNAQPSVNTPWQRITHSQKRVFAHIDATEACYIIIQFRARILDIIPGPAQSIHPDLGQQMNIQRAERIESRLARAGIPERAIEHAKR